MPTLLEMPPVETEIVIEPARRRDPSRAADSKGATEETMIRIDVIDSWDALGGERACCEHSGEPCDGYPDDLLLRLADNEDGKL